MPDVSLCGNLGSDSSVDIATQYRLDGLGVESWREARFTVALNTHPQLVLTLKKE
jgi:hypothetical protein